MKFSVFLKPKGFIKIPEFIFSICAFSVLVSYADVLKFSLECDSDIVTTSTSITSTSTTSTASTSTASTSTASTSTASSSTTLLKPLKAELTEDVLVYNYTDKIHFFPIKYPFKFERYEDDVQIPDCNGEVKTLTIEDKSSSKAVFFVFVGVMTFIYTLFMIPIYLFEDDFFSSYQYYPTVDLFVHIIYLIFWFCAAISWTAGEANLKVSTSKDSVIELNGDKFNCSDKNVTCNVIPPGDYTEAVVAVVFGYLNLFLFGGNLWFVYKDTNLHS